MSDTRSGSSKGRLWPRLAPFSVVVLIYLDAFTEIERSPLIPVIALAVLALVLLWVFRRRSVEWANRLALLAISALVILAAVEAVFRYKYLEHRVPRNEREFERIVTDTWPRRISIERPPGTFRILGLSDSFGRAGGSRNYHYLLEDTLRADGYPVEVVNISVASYSPIDELEAYQRIGARYSPDIVLHGFFVANDFGIPTGAPVVCRGIPFRLARGAAALRPRNLVSATWFRRLMQAFEDYRLRRAESRRDEPTGALAAENFGRLGRRRRPLFEADAPAREHWSETIAVLERLRRAVEESGATYVLLIHPDRFQIEDDLRAELAGAEGESDDRYDFDAPQRFLAEYCRSQQVPCIDLLREFRERGAAGGLFVFRDPHYDNAGNRLAADLIARRLTPLLGDRRSGFQAGAARDE
jgi:hypothetical protein